MSVLGLFRRKDKEDVNKLPSVHVTLDELRCAVLQFEREMDNGINRTVLMKEDGSLDLPRMARYLGGVSDQKFYLSRETFEIFAEEEQSIPYHLDRVQLAVDDYMNETGKLPIVENSVYFEVDCRMLYQQHYLHEIPEFKLYMTDQEMMVTHRQPVALPDVKAQEDHSYVLL